VRYAQTEGPTEGSYIGIQRKNCPWVSELFIPEVDFQQNSPSLQVTVTFKITV